jgi:Xaa-Pro aminopeptidase
MNCLSCNTALDIAPLCFHGYHPHCFVKEATSDNTGVCPFCNNAVIKNSHTVAIGRQKLKELVSTIEPTMRTYLVMTDDRDEFLKHKEEVLEYIKTAFSILNALRMLYTKKDLKSKTDMDLMHRACFLTEQALVLKDNIERSYDDYMAYKQFAKMLDSK